MCQEQLNTQKDRVNSLKSDISKVKKGYADSLKNLEQISNEIHKKRSGLSDEDILKHPREPGVGAELTDMNNDKLPDFNLELDKCEIRSLGSFSETTSSVLSEHDDIEYNDECSTNMEKEFMIRPVDGGGEGSSETTWTNEMENTVDKLDHMLLVQNFSNKNESDCTNKLNS